MSQSDSSDSSDSESTRPFRPNRPSSAGTLLDDRVPTTDDELARSHADLQSIRDKKRKQRVKWTCQYDRCRETFEINDGHDRRFCTHECWGRQKAVALLRDLRFDHRVCANCYNILKRLDPPPTTAPDCASHLQTFFDENTTRALSDIIHKRALIGDEWVDETTESDHKGEYVLEHLDARSETTQCTCSACHHATIDWPGYYEIHTWTREVLPALCEAIEFRRPPGGGRSFSTDALYDKVREWNDESRFQGPEGARRVLEAALGYAICNPHYASE